MSESSQAPCDAAAHAVEYQLGGPAPALGVRFVPTDPDLIIRYLGPKLRGEPLPTDLVLDDRDAYAEHPWKLVAKLGEGKRIEGAWYLFSARPARERKPGMRPKRVPRETADSVGTWKTIGREKPILGGADGKEEFGTKRELWYYESVYGVDAMGKRRRVYKPTRWRMVEFVASDDIATDRMQLNDFPLCKITWRPAKNTPAQGEEDREENDDDNGEEEPTSDGGGESQEKHLSEKQPAVGGGAGAQGDQQRPPPFGGAGSHGNQQPATAEAALVDDLYLGSHGNQQPTAAGAALLDGFYLGSHGNQQPATAEAALLDDYYPGIHGDQQTATAGASLLEDIYDFDFLFDPIMPSIFDLDDDIGTAYGGGETLDAQHAWRQQEESSGGGAGSSSDKQQQPTPPDEQQPTPPDEQQQPMPPDEQQQPTPEAPNEEGASGNAAPSQHTAS